MKYKRGHLNCRTIKQREKIIEKYDIEIITVANLLKGRTMDSDAGGIIEDRYYEFRCTSKKNNLNKYTIICGIIAGESLIRFAKIKDVIVFNPLKREYNIDRCNNSVKCEDYHKIKWDKTAKELFYAINILEFYWKKSLNNTLYRVKKEIMVNRDKEPSLQFIKKVNNCIAEDRTRLKISDMILKLREEDERVRDFNFKNINNILEKNNIESNFS